MNNSTPQVIARSDYKPAGYSVETVHLQFELDATATLVKSVMTVCRNEGTNESDLPLDGMELELVEIKMDGVNLSGNEYTVEPIVNPTTLTIHNVPERSVVEIMTRINPQANTVLEGLYLSSGNYCTQCEAEGFRRITWFPDRPDVMSRFSVKIIADKSSCPVLLSNGNEVSGGDLEDGRHWLLWEDPWPKPSYLFALVAGDLAVIKSRFVTASDRAVDLHIYVQQHNVDKCDHAMDSLRLAMEWDEKVYGLEYDLDRYMIVAVDDFNMGAMENKGLNVFNSKYVLADQATATDTDFLGIESVIAHEYFHNWTGNRVTCRDWFQLSLKEGLTVFRDQEFSADQHSRAVKRIEDVRLLRARQFPEDAGPMAHPVRPDSYIEINNFYTLTIYEKGAEVIRMMHTFLGATNFHAGMDLYFSRHDGQAVTCEDFVLCMEAASKTDLSQFRLWYTQSGTPRLKVTDHYDAERCIYTIKVIQSLPPTSEQPTAEPMHIPFVVSLYDDNGQALPVTEGSTNKDQTVSILSITDRVQEFQFVEVRKKPLPSLLRGFSAPVILDFDYSDDDLAFMLTHESDPFNRWEAGQRLAKRVIESFDQQTTAPAGVNRNQLLINAFEKVLTDSGMDRAFKAEVLTLPEIETIAETHEIFEVDRLAECKSGVQHMLAAALEEQLDHLLSDSGDSGYSIDTSSMGKRALANICLAYLARLDCDERIQSVRRRFTQSDNMTDQIAALRILVEFDQDSSQEYLNDFYHRWKNERLVIDKWFSVQAAANVADAVDRVSCLLEHKDFDYRNPNRVRSLLGAFSNNNPVAFHQQNGLGYQLLADQIVVLDDINPQVAARLALPLTRWKRIGPDRKTAMKSCLQLIADKSKLSRDVFEVVNRALDR